MYPIFQQIRAGYSERSKCFEIHTDIPCKRWNQAFISYGPHDNSKLLLEYGFVLPENPQNSISIRRGKQYFQTLWKSIRK